MLEKRSVYFNHAGTSWPKPDCVDRVISKAVKTDPYSWPEQFDRARQRIIDYFHVPDPTRMLITPGCTSALSIAIGDQAWFPKDVVLTSSFEHHALHRPLFKLTEIGVDLEVLPRTESEPLVLEVLENRLRAGGVKLIAISAASNVTGELLPVEETIRLAREHGALVLIDGAQVAGWSDIDIPLMDADLFCWAGHKALHAPWGIGGLYVAKEVCLNSLSSECETSEEDEGEGAWHGCSSMPTYCDAGSANVWAMIGMAAALDWLDEPAQANRLEHARGLTAQLYDALAAMADVFVYGPQDPQLRMPTVAFSTRKMLPAKMGQALRRKGIISGYGLHCSPLAHRKMGTGPHGLVRLSCGPLNTQEEIAYVIESISQIVKAG